MAHRSISLAFATILFWVLMAEQALTAPGTIIRDLAYGPDPAQRMDVYLSPSTAARSGAAPVLVMAHGGGWRIGDKAARGVVDNKVARWVTAGYVFVSVNYRMLPTAQPHAQAEDLALAVATAQAKAKSWGADPTKFLLMGHSAGAHLVALMSAAPAKYRTQGLKPWLGSVLLDSAALDVVGKMSGWHPRLFDDAFGADPLYWRTVSPLHQLTKAAPPMLIVCSSLRQDPCPQARAFAAAAGMLGARVEVLPQQLTHMQINRDLGLAGNYTQAVENFMTSLVPRRTDTSSPP